ncbi:hypothetical protein FACUT_5555 [Fusarium acutatum]|uniref:Uncharacterized protein n=1 Tax=Fusarium acutatum TaxID=78861 RepID=A0A8H4JV41_9HYPO|nr:hypothetical protein FACUT_5555 [Fusarium acutatum]
MQAAEYASKRAHATMHPSTGVDPTKNQDTYWKTALMTEERDWEKVPPPARDTLTLSDILGQTDPHLAVVSRTGLIGMSLQYYQLPGETECRQHFFFELNENETGGKLYGYCDALLQWMIRLNMAKFLGWSCIGMDFEEANFAGDGEYMGDLKFDIIIHNKFKSDHNELGDNMKRIIDVEKTPIKRGVWLDENFTRPLEYRLAKLPYEGPPAWRDAVTNASVDKWFEEIDDWFATGEFAKE